MGETRVDLLHLLEDLRDAYPGATEETILTEIVANALDSGAATIAVLTDPRRRARSPLVDDGHGMRRRELARYHDIAASAQDARPGHRLRRASGSSSRSWWPRGGRDRDSPRRRARRDGLGAHLPAARALAVDAAARARRPLDGTAVRLTAAEPVSPLLDPGFVEARCAGTSSRCSIRLRAILVAHYPQRRRLRRQRPPGSRRSLARPIRVRAHRGPSGPQAEAVRGRATSSATACRYPRSNAAWRSAPSAR